MACNHKTEVYSRVVGYYRPVQQWNQGKQAEYAQRKTFKVNFMSFSSKEQQKQKPVVVESTEPLIA